MENIPDDDNPLASPEELERIAEIKAQFAAEFERRKSDGTDHPAFFGDIKLTRVLRGMGGDVDQSIKWYSHFLKLYSELDVDGMLAKLPDVTAAGEVDLKAVPGHECFEHMSMIWNAPRLTPKGDVLCYMPLSDFDVEKIVELDLLDRYKAWPITDGLLRDMHLDHLSRIQRRVVKVIWIWDFSGASLGKVFNQRFYKFAREEIVPFKAGLGVELIHLTICLNPPIWVNSIWKVLKRWLPQRFTSRVRFLGADFATDRSFLRYVGSEQLASFKAIRKVKDNEEGEGDGEKVIVAGGIYERTFVVKSGQHYEWSFQVKSMTRTVDLTLGPPTVEFSVCVMWDNEKECLGEADGDDGPEPNEEDPTEATAVVEPCMFSPADGTVAGSFDATRAGLLAIRWSNSFSWVRRKTISISISAPSDDTQQAGIE